MKHGILMFALLLSTAAFAQKEAAFSEPEKGQIQAGLMLGAGVGNSFGGYIRATPYTHKH